MLDADFSENLPRPASAEPLKSQISKSLKNRNSPIGTPRRGCSASSIWGDVLQVSPNPALSCTDMPSGGAGRDELVFSRVFPAAEPEKGTAPLPASLNYVLAVPILVSAAARVQATETQRSGF